MGVFHFKQFDVDDSGCGMKIGTDGVLLGAWAHMPVAGRVLDVGTGSGLIALMLAQRYPTITIEGLDIDAEAVAAAQANFGRSPWAGRLAARRADFLSMAGEAKYAAIVSNPPYFATGERSGDGQRSLARHQDSLTVNALVEQAARLLVPGGVLVMVTPPDQADDIIFHAELAHLKLRRRCDVYSGGESATPKRILWQFAYRADGPIDTTRLVVPSPQHRALTAPFYLNF